MPDRQAGLRRDISALSAVLGRTLVRQEGADLLDLFEHVRHLIGTDREAARRSVLTKIQQIAGLLDEWDRALGPGDGPPDGVAERRVRRRLEGWSTCCGRPTSCASGVRR